MKSFIAIVLATVFSVGSISAVDRDAQFQTSRGAGIEVSARFDNRTDVLSGSADRFHFSLALDTHATDLFAIDIEASTELYYGGERLTLSEVTWEGETENSHHRYGLLTVRAPEFFSVMGRTGPLEFRLRNVGRSDRSFKWALER